MFFKMNSTTPDLSNVNPVVNTASGEKDYEGIITADLQLNPCGEKETAEARQQLESPVNSREDTTV